MPDQPTNFSTFVEYMSSTVKALDDRRAADMERVDAHILNLTASLKMIETKFDGHIQMDEFRFGAIERDFSAYKQSVEEERNANEERRRDESKERGNWIRTGLTLIGGAGIIKLVESAISSLKGGQ